MNKITLFSMAGSSEHNSAKPRPRARSPIYLCSTCHKESEYVVKSQKFFPIFSLVLPELLSYMYSRLRYNTLFHTRRTFLLEEFTIFNEYLSLNFIIFSKEIFLVIVKVDFHLILINLFSFFLLKIIHYSLNKFRKNFFYCFLSKSRF